MVTGCCQPNEVIPDDLTTPQSSSEVLDLQELIGVNAPLEEKQTPDEIPLDVLADPDVYPITTRIIIEGQPAKFYNAEGKMIEGLWWARTIDEVKRDLEIAEQVFSKVAIKFVVTEISFREFCPDLLQKFVEANNRPGVLTVVYMLPNSLQWDGYSSGPWESANRGIVIHYLADKWTLAHELGHYFGLLHTFTEDLVDDTPPQTAKYCTGKKSPIPNCRNIMNYCDHEPKFATDGQIERFKRFFRSKRLDHVDRDRPDLLLSNPFPIQSHTIIFDIANNKAEVKADE